MSVRKRITRAFITLGAVLSVVIVLAPAGASAHVSAHGFFRPTTFGVTSLTLNPSTAATLTSAPPAGLGLTVGPVAPAYASANGDLNFPIVSSPLDALRTGDIDHTGGIAISGGGKTVDLTNFVISVNGQSLTADVSVLSQGSTTSLGAVNIVGLSFSGSRLHLGFGGLSLGPVAATLNSTALGALGSVFGVPALGTTITSRRWAPSPFTTGCSSDRTRGPERVTLNRGRGRMPRPRPQVEITAVDVHLEGLLQPRPTTHSFSE